MVTGVIVLLVIVAVAAYLGGRQDGLVKGEIHGRGVGYIQGAASKAAPVAKEIRQAMALRTREEMLVHLDALVMALETYPTTPEGQQAVAELLMEQSRKRVAQEMKSR